MKVFLIALFSFLSFSTIAGTHGSNIHRGSWEYRVISTKMKECKIDTPVFLCSEDDVVTGKPHVYSVDCGDGVSNYYLKRMSIMDGFSEFRYTVRLEMVDIKTGGRDYFLLSEATKS